MRERETKARRGSDLPRKVQGHPFRVPEPRAIPARASVSPELQGAAGGAPGTDYAIEPSQRAALRNAPRAAAVNYVRGAEWGGGARRRRAGMAARLAPGAGAAGARGGGTLTPAPYCCQSAGRRRRPSPEHGGGGAQLGPEREAEPAKTARVVGSELVDMYTVCWGPGLPN